MMSVPAPNMLSAVANHLGQFISTQVDGNPIVVVGPPADAVAAIQDKKPVVNLFFYKLSPSGFYPDAKSSDPFQIRIQCLITAFGKENEGNGTTETVLSEGEFNLRLLGAIMQKFHEKPEQHVSIAGAGPLSQTLLQIIFAPLNIEELNQIWATQGDIIFRTSLAYEIAMVPIVTQQYPNHPDRAATIEIGVVPHLDQDRVNITPRPLPQIEFKGEPGVEGKNADTRKDSNGKFFSKFEGANETEGAPKVTVGIAFPARVNGPHKLILRQDPRKTKFSQPDQTQNKTAVISSTDIANAGEIEISLPTKNGNYLIYVDSHFTDQDGLPTPCRSNILTVKLAPATKAVANGGGN